MRTGLDHIPASRTKMRSACRTVDKRWAMMTVVRPSAMRCKERWMAASVSLSTAEVASSRMSTGRPSARPGPGQALPLAAGQAVPSFAHQRGIAVGEGPDEGVSLGRLCGRLNLVIVASGRPYRMFSITLVGNRVTCWSTKAMFERREVVDHSRRSCPHQVTAPSLGSMNRINRRMSVVFPSGRAYDAHGGLRFDVDADAVEDGLPAR